MKYCKRCQKKIKILDKGVTWITFDNGKDIETIHWHFQCFIDWRDESIKNRAEKIYINTIEKIMPGAKKMVQSMVNNANVKIEG